MKKLTIFLALCLLLAACAQEPSQITEESIGLSTSAPEETSPEVTTFLVYTPNDTLDGFVATQVQGEQLTVLEALVDAGVLTEDVQINSFTWSGTDLTVDMNAAFRDLICAQGTTGEWLTMGCVVNTLLSACQAETVTITVEGEIWESGHVIYDYPMTFFE